MSSRDRRPCPINLFCVSEAMTPNYVQSHVWSDPSFWPVRVVRGNSDICQRWKTVNDRSQQGWRWQVTLSFTAWIYIVQSHNLRDCDVFTHITLEKLPDFVTWSFPVLTFNGSGSIAWIVFGTKDSYSSKLWGQNPESSGYSQFVFVVARMNMQYKVRKTRMYLSRRFISYRLESNYKMRQHLFVDKIPIYHVNLHPNHNIAAIRSSRLKRAHISGEMLKRQY